MSSVNQIEKIRDPLPASMLAAELSPRCLVRTFRGIEIYLIDAATAPMLMQEIGRIREVEFRREGGGTGKRTDIDEFDSGATPFRQIVAWDPLNSEIVGMYRFQLGGDSIRSDGSVESPTARLFSYSQRFTNDYLPFAIELGRSVVNREARRAAMGLFATWAGLGALVAEFSECNYFFGKFTIFPSYDPTACSILLRFVALHCGDEPSLLGPREPYCFSPACGPECDIFSGDSFDSDYQRLQQAVQAHGETIPPLVISYLRLSPSMQCFGTATNPHFGGVLETAMLIRIADIGSRARKRFIDNYISVNPGAFRSRALQ